MDERRDANLRRDRLRRFAPFSHCRKFLQIAEFALSVGPVCRFERATKRAPAACSGRDGEGWWSVVIGTSVRHSSSRGAATATLGWKRPPAEADDGKGKSILARAMLEKGQELRTMSPPTESTLLDLVQIVQRQARSEAEVVEVVTDLIKSGRVRLRGNFAGSRF
jgi:hypothetical protein